MGLLRFAIKSSIAGGAVYYTVQEGIWSNPEESAKAYNKLYSKVSPLLQKSVPQEVIKEIEHIPNPLDFKTYAVGYWNRGVMASIEFLSDLPTHVSNGIEKIKKEIEKSNLSSSEASKPAESK